MTEKVKAKRVVEAEELISILSDSLPPPPVHKTPLKHYLQVTGALNRNVKLLFVSTCRARPTGQIAWLLQWVTSFLITLLWMT